MSERERWVVYPLLFLALGAALRDKLIDRTTARSIVCQDLSIVDEETSGSRPPRVLATIGRTKEGGASLAIDGQLEIVDGDPTSLPPPRLLATIGKTNRTPGAHSKVAGEVNVHGVINSAEYAYQGIPFMPTWQTLPVVSIRDLLQALQRSLQNSEQADAPKGPVQRQPPTSSRKKSREPAPTADAGESAPAK
jgi:hypothetical protein